MKKLLILLVGLLLSFNANISCAKQPKLILPENHEVYQAYFEDYAKALFENFHPEWNIFRFLFDCENFDFALMRDGTIKELHYMFENSRFTRYCAKVIKRTPTKPFPPEMKDDYVVVSLHMGYDEVGNFYDVQTCRKLENHPQSMYKKQNLDNLEYFSMIPIDIYRHTILSFKSRVPIQDEDED